MNRFAAKGFLFISILLLMLLAACSGGNDQAANKTTEQVPSNQAKETDNKSADSPAEQTEPLPITFMVPSFDTELPNDNSPVLQQLQAYTNTKLTMQFVPNSSYDDTMNITLSSNMLPTVMVVNPKMPSFINAARSGAFWELSEYLQDYPNLSQAHEIVLNNSSIDGKLYGVYRARTLGRMGVSINKEWMDRLGLQPPTTIDEFYQLLKAFKEQDPDGNGVDDTYGIVITKYAGPWDMMQVWFGAPNKWGVDDESGKLVPTHQTAEYKEALQFFRKLYVEGLVNEDFAIMDPAVWNNAIINGEAGVLADVADAARRIDNAMQEKAPKDEPYMGVYQAPVGPHGHRDMPTSGYANVLAISKTEVKTEEELRRVLHFLDQLNDLEMQDLLSYGIEGRHYDRIDGYIKVKDDLDAVTAAELRGLNQMLMFIGPQMSGLQPTAINLMIEEVQAANEQIVIGNPAEPLVSEVYARLGQQLDNIISDARIQYIVGQIDDAGLEEAFQLWLNTVGQDYIDEINQLYEAAAK